VPIHPGAATIQQERPFGAVGGGPFDRPGDRWREWGEDDFAALAANPQHPVPVLLAQILDVGTAGFEDPQTEKAEHRNQGEVEPVGGISRGCEHRLELQMRQPQGRRFGRVVRPTDIVSR
jgi:hypothetical protein